MAVVSMTSKYDDLITKENASILLLYKVCEEKIVRMLFYFVIFFTTYLFNRLLILLFY